MTEVYLLTTILKTMNRRETRRDTLRRMQDLKEGQERSDLAPLKNPLRPSEFADVSFSDYLRNLEERRMQERNGDNSNNGSGQPKP